MNAELVGVGFPGSRISLEQLPVTVGRDSDVELHLSDPCVSHYHCTIDQIGGTLVVRDLGSKNGTFVNGVRIAEQCLQPGDRLTLGQTEFRARYERQPAKGDNKWQETSKTISR